MPVDREAVLAALKEIADPASDTDIVSAGIVRALNVDNGDVRFVMEIAGSQATAYEAVKAAIEERLAYFAAKNFAEADRIRDELSAQGIQLRDSKDSETGERITTWEAKR